ncbi:MAG: pyrimidine-nucleoside phosphorylase, partial [Clostridia bacterium]|nr:pyrimidine-nucleoside phosphorylase [Clostridia bacterium]
MNIKDIIVKKADGGQLCKQEIEFAVMGYVNGDIPDYQMSSLLMAIKINGMTDQETFDLTDIMLHSGDVIDLSDITRPVDKHSTGGVSDTTTIVIAPICACLGVNMLKLSGRGLGHTGGTIDKLEAFSGFNVEVPLDKAKKL